MKLLIHSLPADLYGATREKGCVTDRDNHLKSKTAPKPAVHILNICAFFTHINFLPFPKSGPFCSAGGGGTSVPLDPPRYGRASVEGVSRPFLASFFSYLDPANVQRSCL